MLSTSFQVLVFTFGLTATAETWLGSHSFAEPLSINSLKGNWYSGGDIATDVNGLTMLGDSPNTKGWISSKQPLMTNTFQLTMAMTIVTNAENGIKPGDTMRGDPGMMIMLQDSNKFQQPPSRGDFFGLYPEIEGKGIFFALTSRDGKVSPSISFGAKDTGHLQTPVPRGIYWNYLDKNEFELMLDVQDGKEVFGYIRSKSSDRWTQAFSETLEDDNFLVSNSHLLVSAQSSDLAVSYKISRMSVFSQDDEQPGYHENLIQTPEHQKAPEGEEETLSDVKEALFQMTELFAKELSKSRHFFEEQRNHNKLVLSLIEQVKGALQESHGGIDPESMQVITSRMENMERSLVNRPMKKWDDTLGKVESMFNSLTQTNDMGVASKDAHVYMMMGVLAVIAIGMAYVIFHMKKLEKKHIL